MIAIHSHVNNLVPSLENPSGASHTSHTSTFKAELLKLPFSCWITMISSALPKGCKGLQLPVFPVTDTFFLNTSSIFSGSKSSIFSSLFSGTDCRLLFRILHALENSRSGFCLQIWLAEWLDCCPSQQSVPHVSWLKIVGRVLRCGNYMSSVHVVMAVPNKVTRKLSAK